MTMTLSVSRRPSIAQDSDGLPFDASVARRNNALSNKLTGVLSSSYADSEIRDALRIYDAKYNQQESNAELDLKYEAQKEVIEVHASIIDDFAKVVKQLNRVGALIDNLNATCSAIRKHVLAAKQETAPMLEDASTLLAQKAETRNKQALLTAFNKHFLISDEELTALTSSAEPVNERFFEVLARVKQIHKDCELLLGYENQRLGLELMEQTTRNLNAGYKKLFNWTLRAFKGLDLEDPHISGSIRRSLRALSERPALFQTCLDSFAEARQSTVSGAFQQALTDSTMGAARAIDFSTHDPLRYMGDMLAWVHSATVSEMEALEGLFISDADEINRGLHSGKASDPFAMAAEDDEAGETPFDGHAALNTLISRNMASVAQTLTQRIKMTVRNMTEPVEIYNAYNLLTFYLDMFRKLIRHSTSKPLPVSDPTLERNTILSTLADLLSQTFKHFETTTLDTLHSNIDDTPSADLSPPLALAETLTQFSKIVLTRSPNLTTSEFAKLYATLVKPVLDSCQSLADDLTGSQTEDDRHTYAEAAPRIIYQLNYMSLVRNALAALANGPGSSTVAVAVEPLHHANNEITLLRTSLIELLKDRFAHDSGLDELSNLLSDIPTAFTATKARAQLLRQYTSEEPDGELVLQSLAAKLDTFLASALMDVQDELAKLVDREIAAFVARTAVEIFCEAFETVARKLEEVDERVEHEALARSMGKGANVDGDVDGLGEGVGDDEQGMPKLREIYPRTLDEVRALLS